LQKFLSNFAVIVAEICKNLLNFSDTFLLSDMCYTVVFFVVCAVILYGLEVILDYDTLVFRNYDLFQYY